MVGLPREEGRKGVWTKGLQKWNLWYCGNLTTPRNHPHTLHKQWATWRMRVCVCALGSSCKYGVVCRIEYNKEKNTFWDLIIFLYAFVHQIENYNWIPTTLVCYYTHFESPLVTGKLQKICYDISMKTPQTVNEEVYIRNSCLQWFNFTWRQQCRVAVPHLLYKKAH